MQEKEETHTQEEIKEWQKNNEHSYTSYATKFGGKYDTITYLLGKYEIKEFRRQALYNHDKADK